MDSGCLRRRHFLAIRDLRRCHFLALRLVVVTLLTGDQHGDWYYGEYQFGYDGRDYAVSSRGLVLKVEHTNQIRCNWQWHGPAATRSYGSCARFEWFDEYCNSGDCAYWWKWFNGGYRPVTGGRCFWYHGRGSESRAGLKRLSNSARPWGLLMLCRRHLGRIVEASLDHQAFVVRDPGQKKFEFGKPAPSVKNAVKMIQPFYSKGATVEKARSFWDAFERETVGLNDAVRLNAFRVLLKGKTGEDWWMYSRIEDFLTLKTRFYNQFICLTPLRMIERLKSAKRSKGMFVEVWGDVISNLCDSAQVTDPQTRYQYFLACLRNKEWKAALQSTMVNNIPQVVMTLLYKNMHLPTEDESEFVGETTKKSTSEESVMQQMMGLPRTFGGVGRQYVSGDSIDHDVDISVSTTPEGPTTESVLQSSEATGLEIPFATDGDEVITPVNLVQDEVVKDAVAEATTEIVAERTTNAVAEATTEIVAEATTNTVAETATTYVTGVTTSMNEQQAVVVEEFDDAGTVPVEGPVGSDGCASLECNEEGSVDTESLAKLTPYPTDADSGITVEKVRSKDEGVPPSICADEVEFVNKVKHNAISDVGEPVAAELDSRNDDVVMIGAEQVADIVEGDSAPMFTHEALDMLEKVSTIGAVEELEEYDKELEERLHPLDEVELKRRLKKNAARLQSLTLKEMSVLLKIPVETLRENRETSPGETSTPEYWLAWYKKTLAVAKCANRDFQRSQPDKENHVVPVYSVLSDDRDVGGGVDAIAEEVRLGRLTESVRGSVEVDPESVLKNIGVDLMKFTPLNKRDSMKTDEEQWIATNTFEPLLHRILKRYRTLVRQIVYALVREVEVAFSPQCGLCRKSASVEEDNRGLEERVRTKLLGSRDVNSDYRMTKLSSIISRMYEDRAETIRARLLVRGSKCQACRQKQIPSRRDVPVKHVRFDCSSLFSERIEAFPDRPPRLDEENGLYQYVYVVSDDKTKKQDDLPGLYEVSNEDEDLTTDEGCLGGIKLVIGSVNGVEAVSAGNSFIGFYGEDSQDPVTVKKGKLLVEVCNASTEDVLIRRGTTEALDTLAPDSAFGFESDVNENTHGSLTKDYSASEGIDSVLSSVTVEHENSSAPMPELDKVLKEELDVDFSGPKLSMEQQHWLKELLEQFKDMFVETSMTPGRTDLLEFSINTRSSPPIKQHDILDVLGNAKLFSTMDIASGYWNVPMAVDSVEKTAFTCKYGLYEWLVMPFGLCNAVPAFERLMKNVLLDLKWGTCLVFLDDCVVFSDDFPTHLIRLKQVLERFRGTGFKLKMKKSKWGRDQVTFLGHIVTPSGILPNPEKVKAVINVKHGVDGRERVIAYASKLLVGSEKNWIHKEDGTSEIECWGIVWATRKFRCYLDRQEFDLFTDHKALTWVFNENNRTTNAKLARWAMELSQLRFKVFHKAGTLMGHVDGLSRLHSTSIAALTMADLLYDDGDEEEVTDPEDHLNFDGGDQVQVREPTLLMSDLLNDADLNDDGSVQVRENY
ncbi:hypothetical protein PHMEG_00013970 [Phytophthora megakarya]|uniref:Reverse transcriptase n=1 Tax=Phytophthora megakarya TaxID=4795 RepID=A0A225W6M1_9STRA|nr:hypothetical protein PHMEG_00013970 [Phytophthora megakarya]